jgi:hypothetical protein
MYYQIVLLILLRRTSFKQELIRDLKNVIPEEFLPQIEPGGGSKGEVEGLTGCIQ